jgi:hypothetical protein
MPSSNRSKPTNRLSPSEAQEGVEQLKKLVELARTDPRALDQELERMFPGAKAPKSQPPSKP